MVDAGVAGERIEHPQLVDRRIAAGTKNFLDGPAMTPEQAQQALDHGAGVAHAAAGEALAFGEMGIANTATAAALAHKLTGRPLADLVGRGTGLDDAGLNRKLDILTRATARTGTLTPEQAMAEYGGFEINMIAGAMIETARENRVVIVDGFIASVAALLATKLQPDTRRAMGLCPSLARIRSPRGAGRTRRRPASDARYAAGRGDGRPACMAASESPPPR